METYMMDHLMDRLNELTPSQISVVIVLVVVTIIAGIVLLVGIKNVWKKQDEIDLSRGE